MGSHSDKDWVRLDEIERRYIAEVLRHTHGRITGAGGAATILGLNPSTLSWRIGKLGLREVLAEARGTGRERLRTGDAGASKFIRWPRR